MTKSKFIGLLLVAAMSVCAFGKAEASNKGEKTFGIHTGYISRNISGDVGLFFQYAFSKNFRLQPSADLVFRHNDRDAFLVDLNAQFPIGVNDDNFSLYPFAGLNFSSWNHHYRALTEPVETEDGIIGPFEVEKSSRTNRFGVNLGAGFDLKITSTLKVSIEATYTFVKSNSGLRVLAGIGYVF